MTHTAPGPAPETKIAPAGFYAALGNRFQPSRWLFAAGLLTTAWSAPLSAAIWPVTGAVGLHDPSIIKEGSTWWLFSTGAGACLKSSGNGVTWTEDAPLFPSERTWWRTYAPRMNPNDVRAPDVHRFGQRTWCYYSVSEMGTNNSAIGLMSCTSIAAGDWRDDGLVLSSQSGVEGYNALDPNLTVDAAGNPWLVFGSWFDGIHLVQLSSSTMKPIGVVQALAKRSRGIEGAHIVQANGYYYLFVTIDRGCLGANSSYKIAYGRSTTITGPYLDKNGRKMMAGGCTLLDTGTDRFVGPGGPSVYQNGNAWVMAHHAFDTHQQGASVLIVQDLRWDAAKWPSY